VYEIVGVMPPDFRFLWNDIGLWLPAAFTPEQMSTISVTATTGRWSRA